MYFLLSVGLLGDARCSSAIPAWANLLMWEVPEALWLFQVVLDLLGVGNGESVLSPNPRFSWSRPSLRLAGLT
jgi:hypothetical protein